MAQYITFWYVTAKAMSQSITFALVEFFFLLARLDKLFLPFFQSLHNIE